MTNMSLIAIGVENAFMPANVNFDARPVSQAETAPKRLDNWGRVEWHLLKKLLFYFQLGRLKASNMLIYLKMLGSVIVLRLIS